MFQVSFWCVDFPVLIPDIKWSCYPDIFPLYVCGEGAWFTLNFHVMLKTSFIVTRALFRVLCSGVSVSVFGLCVKIDGNCAATGRISCRCYCGSWMCMTGMIRLTHHQVFACLDSFVYFYWLCRPFCCSWYDPSYWSLLLSLALLICSNP